MKNKWLILYYAVRLLLAPRRIDILLKFGDALSRLRGFEIAAAEALKNNSDLHRLAVERYVGPHPAPTALEKLPAGTLGHEYAKFLEKNKLSPYALFPAKAPVEKDADYLKERARYLHDIAHVVLGLSADMDDEAALNTFLLAQTSSPVSALIVAGCIVRGALTDPTHLRPMLDKVSAQWRNGREARGFLAFRWEEHWQTPLVELREIWARA